MKLHTRKIKGDSGGPLTLTNFDAGKLTLIGILFGSCYALNYIPLDRMMIKKTTLTPKEKAIFEMHENQKIVCIPQFTVITKAFINDGVQHLKSNANIEFVDSC